jgi:23S rRNA (pseudouridine1915-N3)-methyltransferase
MKKGCRYRQPLCDRVRIQTLNLLIRSQMLYSIELRSRLGAQIYIVLSCSQRKNMTIELWSLGKSDNKELEPAINLYFQRLKHYTKFNLTALDNSKINKKLSLEQILDQEADLVLQKLRDKDLIVTLDERGTELTSTLFANKINQWMNQSPTRLIFLIGGSYGISERVHQRAAFKFSLSKLTFPHQLVRLFFTEQLYRAFTILKNEKYHHE